MEVEFTNLEKVDESKDEEESQKEGGEAMISENTDIQVIEQEDSDISDVMLDSSSPVFKWLTKITDVDLRIRCDVFMGKRKCLWRKLVGIMC